MTTAVSLPELRVAIIGSGPAGIYAADNLLKSTTGEQVKLTIDIFEKLPTPFGLIRYGVAPDHPRIKGIISSLHTIMENPAIRFFGNVEFGKDITLKDLQSYYQAIIFATGAIKDKPLTLPGADLTGNYGAADFVAWYDAHPDFPTEWPLEAEQIAVIGMGNVGLDIARILAKTAEELLATEIPAHVHSGLQKNRAKEIHIFGRRGPAQAKFTPLELKELNSSPNIDVLVSPEDIDYDADSMQARRDSKIVDQVASILEHYALAEPSGANHKIHIHLFENPVAILGDQQKVTGLRTERMQYTEKGGLQSTGKTTDWPVQAVYRAIGYQSTTLPDVPFDPVTNTIPHQAGRVLQGTQTLPGLYTTGWIKRGPVGLIGSTKSDAQETIESLLTDFREGILPAVTTTETKDIQAWLTKNNISYTTWEGWLTLNQHEIACGEKAGRPRIKTVGRENILKIANQKFSR